MAGALGIPRPAVTVPSRLKGPCLRRRKPLRPETSEGREQGRAWVRVLATPTILFPWSFSSRSSTFPSSSSPSPALVSHPHREPGPACLCALSRPLTMPSYGTSGSNVAFKSVLRPPPHPQVSSVTLPEFCPIPPSIPHLPIPPSSVIISPSCPFRFLFYSSSFSLPVYPVSRPLGAQHHPVAFLCIYPRAHAPSWSFPFSLSFSNLTTLRLTHLFYSLYLVSFFNLKSLIFPIFAPSQTFLSLSFIQ